VYAMKKWMGCSTIYIINRDKKEVDDLIAGCQRQGYGDNLIHVSSVEQAEQSEGPGAIVSCVPNFPPRTPEELTARRVLEILLDKEHKGAILEMCYHPTPWTEIAEISQKAGWQLILGTEAMIWQGLEQDRFWTGRPINQLPVEKVHEVIAAKLSSSRL